MKKKKFRVIVRQWVPRKIPQQILVSTLDEVLANAYPKLKKVVYVGWIKRELEGKKILKYLVATGETGLIARKNFKKSEEFGENVWIVV